MSRRPFALLLLAALLAGCEPAPDIADVTPAEPTPEAAPSGGYEAIVGGADALVVLASDGTEVRVPFGMTRDEALAALRPFLGEPTSDDVNGECPMGPTRTVAWSNGLSLLFPDGEDGLSGWVASGDDERLQGPDGVQLGMPRDLLLATDIARMEPESSLENEFTVGAAADDASAVGGFLNEDGALVNELFAGATCYAR